MDLKLAGKKVLISGGSKGIGRAAVDIFAEEGAIVSFCARNQEEVSAAELAANQLGSGSVYGSVVDVGDEAQLQAWVESAAKTMGGIDVVVANVSALAIPSTKENWEASFNVDLMHTVRMVEAAMPFLEVSEHASIVTVSSVSGREVDFASGPYGTMKTAIIAYTQGLASSGIRANSVSPGNTYFPGGVWESIEGGNPDLFKTALDLNPTGRMGTPREMASAIVFLASPSFQFHHRCESCC